jgi:hypothetical protein
MEQMKDLFEPKKRSENVLVVLFAFYLVMGFAMPMSMAKMIDSAPGKVLVLISLMALFTYGNPLLGVLGVLVAYKLITNAAQVTGTGPMEYYAITEEKKWQPFPKMKEQAYTLEQEMVKQMAPMVNKNSSSGKASYKPILENLHNAERIVY